MGRTGNPEGGRKDGAFPAEQGTPPHPQPPGRRRRPRPAGSEGERPLWGLCVQSWVSAFSAGSPPDPGQGPGERWGLGELSAARQDTPGPRLQWPLLCLFIGGWVGGGADHLSGHSWSRLGCETQRPPACGPWALGAKGSRPSRGPLLPGRPGTAEAIRARAAPWAAGQCPGPLKPRINVVHLPRASIFLDDLGQGRWFNIKINTDIF